MEAQLACETVTLFSVEERTAFTNQFKNRKAVITVEVSDLGLLAHVIAYPILIARANQFLLRMRTAT